MRSLTIVLLLIVANTYSQGVDGERVLLQDIVIDSLEYTKAELHAKTKEWFGHSFSNAKAVITSDSDE